jgi:hypothetical protein
MAGEKAIHRVRSAGQSTELVRDFQALEVGGEGMVW